MGSALIIAVAVAIFGFTLPKKVQTSSSEPPIYVCPPGYHPVVVLFPIVICEPN